MSAPLGPAGLVVLILTAWAAVGLLAVLGTTRAAKRGEQDGAPLTAAEQAALAELELQFREQR